MCGIIHAHSASRMCNLHDRRARARRLSAWWLPGSSGVALLMSHDAEHRERRFSTGQYSHLLSGDACDCRLSVEVPLPLFSGSAFVRASCQAIPSSRRG